MDPQPAFVVDKTKFPELVHEKVGAAASAQIDAPVGLPIRLGIFCKLERSKQPEM